MAELKEFTIKRGIVKGKLTKFATHVDNHDVSEALQLQIRFDRAVGLLDEFQQIQDRVELLLAANKDELAVQIEQRSKFEDDYCETIAKAKKLLASHEPSIDIDQRSQASDGISAPRVRANVKLPRIELPTFSGGYDKWSSFYDTFDALINQNFDLPDIEKYYYLRSSLKCEAANIIASLEVSSANYTVAWELLKNRFENKKLMIHNHIKGLFDLETIQRESHTSIRNLLDNLNKNIRALDVLQLPTEHWDAMLIYLISSKLPEVTRKEWETQINQQDMPTLEELTTFLSDKAQLLEKIDKNKKSNFLQNKHTISQCTKTKQAISLIHNNFKVMSYMQSISLHLLL